MLIPGHAPILLVKIFRALWILLVLKPNIPTHLHFLRIFLLFVQIPLDLWILLVLKPYLSTHLHFLRILLFSHLLHHFFTQLHLVFTF